MTAAREAELLAQIKVLNERLGRMEALEKENALLRQKLDLLIRRLFGAQSEKLDPAQLLLLLQGFDEPGKAPEPVAAEAPRRSPDPSPPRERGPRVPASGAGHPCHGPVRASPVRRPRVGVYMCAW